MTRFELIRLWVEENFPWLVAVQEKLFSTQISGGAYCIIGTKDRNDRFWRQWVEVDYLRVNNEDWFYFCDMDGAGRRSIAREYFIEGPVHRVTIEDPTYFTKLAELCHRIQRKT